VRCAATAKQQRKDSELLQRPEIVTTDVPLSQQQREALLPQPGAEQGITPTDSTLDAMERWAGNYQMPDEVGWCRRIRWMPGWLCRQEGSRQQALSRHLADAVVNNRTEGGIGRCARARQAIDVCKPTT
jgi:hypothetical protein